MEIKFKIIHEFGPEERAVAMTSYQGRVIIATERGIYELVDDALKPLKFVEPTGGT